MFVKCKLCKKKVYPFGEQIIDLCGCEVAPISIMVQNGEMVVRGPAEKISIMSKKQEKAQKKKKKKKMNSMEDRYYLVLELRGIVKKIRGKVGDEKSFNDQLRKYFDSGEVEKDFDKSELEPNLLTQQYFSKEELDEINDELLEGGNDPYALF